eukprot:3818155-Rhodomonas_salina.2
MLVQCETSRSNGVAPYATAIPNIAQPRPVPGMAGIGVWEYRPAGCSLFSCWSSPICTSAIRPLSTARGVAPYATAVPRIA